MPIKTISKEYFDRFILDESFVVKFAHLKDTREICLMLCVSTVRESLVDMSDAKFLTNCSVPTKTFHKIVFKGVLNYERNGPIYINYRNLDGIEERRGYHSDIVIYGAGFEASERGNEFTAELSGFGEISFCYTELEYDSITVIKKGLSAEREERLYIDIETGRVGYIPELFDWKGFNVGDKVHLKSGGPEMTIKSLNGQSDSSLVNCIWFDSNNSKHSDEFPFEMLEMADGTVLET